jgi:CO/xanthine dehydrogenase Mo-binding subunit
MSQAAGRPVRVQWSRQDEHGWEPLGAGMVHAMEGGVSGASIVAWDHTVYSPTHNSRPNGTNGGSLIAGMLVGMLPATLASAAGTNATTRNAPVNYTFSNRLTQRAVRSFVTQTNGSANGTSDRAPATPLTWKLPRSTALRSLGGFSNTFANESFLGELAAAANLDDLQVRLDHLSDPRGRAVVEALQPVWAARPLGIDGTGAGIAFGRYETIEAYVAAYVEVTVDRTTGVIRVQHAVVAHDCGLIINPDGLRNQIEGQVMQAASRCLKEEVQFSAKGVTSVQWERNPQFGVVAQQYPVLAFNEAPTVEVILIDRPHDVAWGAGEPSIGVVGGAIGNAVFRAVGVRLRSLPMLPAKVLAALAAG